ncbi:hypothetical protein [Anaerosporobacter faecicola]|uniref:hypothetical protein n=1 Tax=Anaerosporobacter faecicola TaxID=2718714 RepID=UPI00143C55C7|nr:hypothetical protein [Anaerosporobacter faecicola]
MFKELDNNQVVEDLICQPQESQQQVDQPQVEPREGQQVGRLIEQPIAEPQILHQT